MRNSARQSLLRAGAPVQGQGPRGDRGCPGRHAGLAVRPRPAIPGRGVGRDPGRARRDPLGGAGGRDRAGRPRADRPGSRRPGDPVVHRVAGGDGDRRRPGLGSGRPGSGRRSHRARHAGDARCAAAASPGIPWRPRLPWADAVVLLGAALLLLALAAPLLGATHDDVVLDLARGFDQLNHFTMLRNILGESSFDWATGTARPQSRPAIRWGSTPSRCWGSRRAPGASGLGPGDTLALFAWVSAIGVALVALRPGLGRGTGGPRHRAGRADDRRALVAAGIWLVFAPLTGSFAGVFEVGHGAFMVPAAVGIAASWLAVSADARRSGQRDGRAARGSCRPDGLLSAPDSRSGAGVVILAAPPASGPRLAARAAGCRDSRPSVGILGLLALWRWRASFEFVATASGEFSTPVVTTLMMTAVTLLLVIAGQVEGAHRTAARPGGRRRIWGGRPRPGSAGRGCRVRRASELLRRQAAAGDLVGRAPCPRRRERLGASPDCSGIGRAGCGPSQCSRALRRSVWSSPWCRTEGTSASAGRPCSRIGWTSGTVPMASSRSWPRAASPNRAPTSQPSWWSPGDGSSRWPPATPIPDPVVRTGSLASQWLNSLRGVRSAAQDGGRAVHDRAGRRIGDPLPGGMAGKARSAPADDHRARWQRCDGFRGAGLERAPDACGSSRFPPPMA